MTITAERDLGTKPVDGECDGRRHGRRSRGHGAGRARRSCAPRASRGSTSPSSAPPTASTRSAPVGSASSRSTAARAPPRRARRRSRPACRSRRQTPRLARLRQGVMELYLSDHPSRLPDRARRTASVRSTTRRRASGCATVSATATEARPISTSTADESNPYFTFDPTACIVCSRCVRACDEIQGTIALTIEGRGFASKVAASADDKFMDSECVSCGACVQVCPTDDARREVGPRARPARSERAHHVRLLRRGLQLPGRAPGDEVVRMVPTKDGGANAGHSCVKGRFAWGYANHDDRVLTPLLRERTTDPVARGDVGRGDPPHRRAIPLDPGPIRRRTRSVASPRRDARTKRCSRSRRWSERRSGNNNVDTCARVLPLADRLRAQADLRDLGRDPGLRAPSTTPT